MIKLKEGREDIQSIWSQFHKDGNDYFRNQLLEHYRDLVQYSAVKLHEKLPDKVELDDLISAGIFGLMDAIGAYDPNRGVKFETYCAPRIKGSILDELRAMDWVPRLVRSRAHQFDNAKKTLENRLGRLPYDIEIAEELDIGSDKYKKLKNDSDVSQLISLESMAIDNDEGGKDIQYDPIDKNVANPLEAVLRRELKELLTEGISRAEKLIIVLYYYEEMSMKEIGATLDLSESRISQMHSSIITRLKASLNSRVKDKKAKLLLEYKEMQRDNSDTKISLKKLVYPISINGGLPYLVGGKLLFDELVSDATALDLISKKNGIYTFPKKNQESLEKCAQTLVQQIKKDLCPEGYFLYSDLVLRLTKQYDVSKSYVCKIISEQKVKERSGNGKYFIVKRSNALKVRESLDRVFK